MIRPLPGLILVLAQAAAPAGAPAAEPPPLVAPATIRIGLSSTDARVLVLGATDGLRVLDAANRRPVWRERFEGDVRVVRIGGAEPRLVYSVQVGSFADEARARELARTLGPRVGTEARVHFDPDRHVWRVRLGAFPERGAAAPLIEELAEAGQPQAWVAATPRCVSSIGTSRSTVSARDGCSSCPPATGWSRSMDAAIAARWRCSSIASGGCGRSTSCPSRSICVAWCRRRWGRRYTTRSRP